MELKIAVIIAALGIALLVVAILGIAESKHTEGWKKGVNQTVEYLRENYVVTEKEGVGDTRKESNNE